MIDRAILVKRLPSSAQSTRCLHQQEVAARLQMSEGAVRVTLHRSLKTLAAMFRVVPNED